MGVVVAQALGPDVLLGKLISADMNVTTDQTINLIPGNKRITKIVAINASATPTLSAGGIYSGASKTGTAFVAAGQAWGALTAILSLDLTIAANFTSASSIILSLTTAKGSAGTCDVLVYGQPY